MLAHSFTVTVIEYEIWNCAFSSTGSCISQGVVPSGSHIYSFSVTHTLTEHHISMLLEHLQWYHAEYDAFLQQILTGDEAECHHFEPARKQAGMQWRHCTSSDLKKLTSKHLPVE